MPAGARESGATVKPPGTAVWDFSRAARAVPPFSVASSSARFFWKMKSLIERTYTTQDPGQDASTSSLEALCVECPVPAAMRNRILQTSVRSTPLCFCVFRHTLSPKKN